MKRFAFRLETLLRHRKNLEEKERSELYRMVSIHHQKCDQMEMLQDKNHATLLELTSKKIENALHEEIHWFYAYLDRLRHEMDLCRKAIAQLEPQIENQKSMVIEAMKRKKVLDTLKTRKAKEFTAQVDKEEQKSVDDIVVVRFPRKSR
jgi:flagellar FliJ protein